MFESQKKEKLDEGKLEVSELGVIQLEEGEPYDDDQDGGQDEVDADDVPCRTRGCRLADSSAQPWESSENCGGGPCTANPQTASH